MHCLALRHPIWEKVQVAMSRPSAPRPEVSDPVPCAASQRVSSVAQAQAPRSTIVGQAAPYLAPCLSALICLAAIIAGGADPSYYFHEGKLMTWLNSAQIALCSLAGWRILAHYWPPRHGGRKTFFWIIVTLGAAYLAVDEVAQLHETHGPLVTLLRYKFGFGDALFVAGKPILTIGDLFELSYGLIALGLCLYHRHEMARHPRALRMFLWGTAFLLFSFAWDCLPFGDLHLWGRTWGVSLMTAVEDASKFVGFGAMLGGFMIRLGEL